jgi:2,3-bisphosphoglycerate-independent phosphoglycerate mutase
MSVLFLFIDGIGIGEDHTKNPFFSGNYPGFSQLCGAQNMTQSADVISSETHLFKPIDARLGVDGLPQSGTGQAALFSGQNAAKIIDRHFGPFPHSKTRYLLESESIFHKVQSLGKKPYFINAFPAIFFERSSRLNRWSCATLMTRSAGLRLNSLDEVLREEAITAEILQDYWHRMLQLEVPSITPRDAVRRVVHALETYDLVLMEYYLTDKAGHAQSSAEADAALSRVDDFIQAFLATSAGTEHTLVISSDHGNVEDLSVKTHTMHAVPLIGWGPGAAALAGVSDLTGVSPAILQMLGD